MTGSDILDYLAACFVAFAAGYAFGSKLKVFRDFVSQV